MKKGPKFIYLIGFMIIFPLNEGLSKLNQIKYATTFENCPKKNLSIITKSLVQKFSKTKSLMNLKNFIVNRNIVKKHFLSHYAIDYGPFINTLDFKYKCPLPLLRVFLSEDTNTNEHEAVLVDSGELFDPTYEVLLRNENKLSYRLPYLSLPNNGQASSIKNKIVRLMKEFSSEFKDNISEIIIQNNELLLILSIDGFPVTTFLGKSEWTKKSKRLVELISFLAKKKRIPSKVNMVHSKKVVVKFADNF